MAHRSVGPSGFGSRSRGPGIWQQVRGPGGLLLLLAGLAACDGPGPGSAGDALRPGQAVGSRPAVQRRALGAPPVANPDTYAVNEDTPLTVAPDLGVLVNDSDAELDQLTALKVTDPSHGTLLLNPDGSFSYAPALDWNGTDSFTYKANDGTSGSNVATVTITVNAVNDAPSFLKGPDVAVNEDYGLRTVLNWATALSRGGGTDEGGQQLDFIVSADNGTLFSSLPSVTSAGTLTFTPAPDASGIATVTVMLHDKGGTANGGLDTSAPQTFKITVNPVNDVPFFAKGPDQTVNEDSGARTVAGWATAIGKGPTNEAGQTLNFVVNTGNLALFTILGQPAIDPATGTLTFTPAANANGSVAIQVQLHDSGGTANGGQDTSAAQPFNINVTAVNDAPSFTKGGNPTVLEDCGAQSLASWATAISRGPADEAAQTLGFLLSNNNSALFAIQPAIDATTGTLSYTPAANANGSTTVTVQLRDSGGTQNGGVDLSTSQTFTLAVTAVNDAPSLVRGTDPTVAEDCGAQTMAGWATAISRGPTDEAGQTLTLTVSNNNNALFSAQPALDPGTGTLTFTPALHANGAATVTLQLRDSGGTANGGVDAMVQQQFPITVTSVNYPPTLTTVSTLAGGQEDTPFTVTYVALAAAAEEGDWDGDALSFRVESVSSGALTKSGSAVVPGTTLLGAGESWAWTPAGNANGSGLAAFTIRAWDGQVVSANAVPVKVDVTAVNDAPSFSHGPNQTVTEDCGPVTVPGWAGLMSPGPADEALQALDFLVSNNNATLFSVQPAIDLTGRLTFTPAPDAYGLSTVTVQLHDNGGTANSGADTSSSVALRIIVNSVNDVPSFTKGPDLAVLQDSGPHSVAGWATNLSRGPANESGQTLTFTVTNDNAALFSTQPAIDASGTLTYTPAAGNTGVANMTVVLKDNGGVASGGVDTSASQPFLISVRAANVPPLVDAGPDQPQILEGQQVNLAPATFFDPDAGDWHTATIDWGDTFSSPGVVNEGQHAVTGSHVYADNGSYTVKVIVTDALGAVGTDTFMVTVDNVRPTIVVGSGQTVFEGSTVSLATTFTDKGTGDTHAATVFWGDTEKTEVATVTETPTRPGNVNGATGSIGNSHVYADNGEYTVTVCVRDDDDPTLVCGTLPVTVRNVLPGIVAGSDQGVAEGASVALSATLTDKGTLDTHTATLDWGDGTGVSNVPPGPGGVSDSTYGPPGNTAGMIGTVLAARTYADNGNYTVRVCVADDDESMTVVCDSLVIHVTNAAPTFVLGALLSVNEGTSITVPLVNFNDKGTLDTHTALIDWADNSPRDVGVVSEMPSGPPGSTSGTDGRVTFPAHVFGRAPLGGGSYPVHICIKDKDAAETCHDLQITVNNVAPTVEAGNSQTVAEGTQVSLAGATFNDKGSQNTHTASINWGDGTLTEAGIVTESPSGPPGNVNGVSGTVAGSHVYADNGSYTVTLTVVDNKGLSNADTFTVTVNNAAPTLVAGASQITSEGAQVSLAPATFNDRGTADTHTATIDWGDGTGVQAIPGGPGGLLETPSGPPGNAAGTSGTISATHVYADNGSYTVTLAVRDKDAAADTKTLHVTVNNAAPSVDAKADQLVSEGQRVSLAPATFNDKGTADTHTATIDWGDGTGVQAVPVGPAGLLEAPFGPPGSTQGASGTVAGSHDFADDSDPRLGPGGRYAVTVCVKDDEGVQTCDVLQVTVNNAPPSAIPAVLNENNQPIRGILVDQRLTFMVDIDTPVDWTARLSSDPGSVDNAALTYHWSFDDTLQSEDRDFSRSFSVQGRRGGTLTVTDPQGASTVTPFDVQITASCVLDVQIGPLGVQPLEEGTLLTFTGQVVNANQARLFSYFWDFGDGLPVQTCSAGPGVADPSCAVQHTYADDGDWTVHLTVQDDLGCAKGVTLDLPILNVPPVLDAGEPHRVTDPVVEGSPFELGVGFSDRGATDTHAVSWDCDGDGEFELTGATGSCTYLHDDFPADDNGGETHRVTVKVVDDDGGEVTGTVDVTVQNAAPVASTVALVDGVAEGSPVQLAASGTDPGADPGDAQLAFHWNFDGVGESAQQNPTFVFPDEGDYRGEVWATDNAGSGLTSLQSAVTTVRVYNRPPLGLGCLDPADAAFEQCNELPAPELPERWLAAPPDAGAPPAWCKRDAGNAVAPEMSCQRFVALASDPGPVDAANLRFAWSFGDNEGVPMGAAGENWWTTHLYRHKGTYTVQLTVQDPMGARSTDSFKVEVTAVAPICQQVGLPDPAAECGDTTVEVLATSADHGQLWYTYDWGDGSDPQSLDNVAQAVHRYTQSGSYTVQVHVENQESVGADCAPLTVEVANELPRALLPETANGTEGQPLRLTAEVGDCEGDLPLLVYSWDFGDGTPSALGTASAAHTYAEPGDYTVTLIVRDDAPPDGDGDADPDAPNVTRTLVHVADLPPQVTLLAPAPAVSREGQCVAFVACAVDPGGQPAAPIVFSWSWDDGSETVDDGQQGALVTCQPDAGAAGQEACAACTGQCSLVQRAYVNNQPGDAPYQLTVTAADPQGAERTASLSMVVSNVAPRVEQPPDYPVEPFPTAWPVGVQLSYRFSADDPGLVDRDAFVWELDQPLQGMTIGEAGEESGLFRWTPTMELLGQLVPASVLVMDEDRAAGTFFGQVMVTLGDEDNDGLPDSYEERFPCLLVGRDDRLGDPDGDGLTNLQEYQRDASGLRSDPCVANTPPAPAPVRPEEGDEEPRGRRDQPPSLALELVVDPATDPDRDEPYQVSPDLPSLHYLFVVGKGLGDPEPAAWQVVASNAPAGHSWDEASAAGLCPGLTDGHADPTVSWSIDANELAAAATAEGITLENAQDVQWRARACDGWGFGPWSATRTFFYNAVNESPAMPEAVRPAAGAEDQPAQPTLEVQPVSPEDPDFDAVTYQFRVWEQDGDPAQPVQTTVQAADPCHGQEKSEDGMVRWIVPALTEDSWYCWHSWGVDDECTAGPPSAPQCFLVNTANLPPGAPALLAPDEGGALPVGRDRRPGGNVVEVGATSGVAFRWAATTDPDGNLLVYEVEYVGQQAWDAVAPGFLEATTSAPLNLGDQAEGSWPVDGLQDNSFYYWRVIAHEADNPGSQTPVPNTGLFFVNTANDLPAAPQPQAIESPTNTHPALTMACATDADLDVLSYACELRQGGADGELVGQAAGGELVELVAHRPGTGTTGACVTDCDCSFSWQAQGLATDQQYCFRCRACDLPAGCTDEGQWGPWSECATFQTEPGQVVPNTCPSEVGGVLTPAADTVLHEGEKWPMLRVRNAVDPDEGEGPLTYVFEVFASPKVDGVDPLVTVTSPEQDDNGSTAVELPAAKLLALVKEGELKTFYWRVRVEDPGDSAGTCDAVGPVSSFSVAAKMAGYFSCACRTGRGAGWPGSGAEVLLLLLLPAVRRIRPATKRHG